MKAGRGEKVKEKAPARAGLSLYDGTIVMLLQFSQLPLQGAVFAKGI